MKPEPQTKTISFRIYRGRDRFRWRLVHRNGNILADGGEAYSSKRGLKRSLENFLTAIAQGDYEVRDETKGNG